MTLKEEAYDLIVKLTEYNQEAQQYAQSLKLQAESFDKQHNEKVQPLQARLNELQTQIAAEKLNEPVLEMAAAN